MRQTLKDVNRSNAGSYSSGAKGEQEGGEGQGMRTRGASRGS